MTDKFDIIIIGGGVMGSSTAYHLTKADPSVRVAVIEKDPTYQYASSALSMANIRIQFSLADNIRISQYAVEALSRFEDEMEVNGDRPAIAFHKEGNLFLYNKATEPDGREAFELQKSMGCPVEWWDPEEITKHYPLYDVTDYVGATWGPQDGHLDAYAVLMGYKAKARSQGATYLADEVTELVVDNGRALGVKTASGETYTAGAVVNCTGAWCADLAATAGVKLPVEPVKRQVFALDVKVKPEGPLPLTFLPTNLYFRTETGNLILVGRSFDDDSVGYSFSYDRERFNHRIWPDLAEFVPAWDELRIIRGWAGLYAVNRLDGNAILGEWPELKKFYLVNGFSGHGLQQGPAVGRYMSELLLGLDVTLDLSVFNPQRILENKPLIEGGLV